MSDIDRICKILMALDARLARIEHKICGEAPAYIGTPPVIPESIKTWVSDTTVIPIRGKIS